MRENETTAVGLLRCLRMLADEADALNLTLTLAALQRAMETCQAETLKKSRPVDHLVH